MMSRRHALRISLAIAVTASYPVSAAVLCVKHDDGALTAREVCKVNETQVDPVALGLQGPPGAALTVRDNNGRFVGLLVDPVFERVARRVGNETVLLDVAQDGFHEFTGLTLLYATGDCSGDAFFPPSPGITDATLTRRGVVVLARQIAYFAVAPVAERTMRSSLELPADHDYCVQTGGTFVPPAGCCRVFEPGGDVFVFGAGALDLREFVPPFHVDGP